MASLNPRRSLRTRDRTPTPGTFHNLRQKSPRNDATVQPTKGLKHEDVTHSSALKDVKKRRIVLTRGGKPLAPRDTVDSSVESRRRVVLDAPPTTIGPKNTLKSIILVMGSKKPEERLPTEAESKVDLPQPPQPEEQQPSDRSTTTKQPVRAAEPDVPVIQQPPPPSIRLPRQLIPLPIDFKLIIHNTLASIAKNPTRTYRTDLILGMIRATKIAYEATCLDYEFRLVESAAALHAERLSALVYMTEQLQSHNIDFES